MLPCSVSPAGATGPVLVHCPNVHVCLGPPCRRRASMPPRAQRARVTSETRAQCPLPQYNVHCMYLSPSFYLASPRVVAVAHVVAHSDMLPARFTPRTTLSRHGAQHSSQRTFGSKRAQSAAGGGRGIFCGSGIRSGDACCAPVCAHCNATPGCEAGAQSLCCARAIRLAGRVCGAADDTGCLIPGAADAAIELCFYQGLGQRACPAERWVRCAMGRCDTITASSGGVNHGMVVRMRHNATGCIARAMAAEAAARGLPLSMLRQQVLAECLSPGPTQTLSPAAMATHSARRERRPHSPHSPHLPRCPVPAQREGRLVVAVVVRDQSRLLKYWVAWHLLLGAHHVIVYDNGSQFESQVAALLAPYVAAGRATVVHFDSSHALKQMHMCNTPGLPSPSPRLERAASPAPRPSSRSLVPHQLPTAQGLRPARPPGRSCWQTPTRCAEPPSWAAASSASWIPMSCSCRMARAASPSCWRRALGGRRCRRSPPMGRAPSAAAPASSSTA